MLWDYGRVGGGRSFQLFRVAGIRIGADLSWFLILFGAIFYGQHLLREELQVSSNTALALAVLGVSLFFVSLIAHELGHAFAARREKLPVEGIDLFLFGGVMKMRGDTRSPGAEFRVAAAGPAVTLLLVFVFLGLTAATAGTLDAAVPGGDAELSPVTEVLAVLASANFVLLLFNLVPAFPLDGGRIARAAIWKATGDRNKATRVAGLLGQGFSMLLILYGLYIAFAKDRTFDGIWLAVLGYMIGQGARTAVVQSAVSERLGGVTVGDLMDAEPVAIPADLPAQRAYEDFFLRYGTGYDSFPVVEPDGRLAGRAHREPLRQAAEGAPELPVRRLLTEEGSESVDMAATLEDMIGNAALRAHGVLTVVDNDGRLRGTVTRDQIVRALQTRLASSSG
jgi:Zn-dependent protease